MCISSTGLYGSATIVNSDIFDDVEALKEQVTTLSTSYLTTTNDSWLGGFKQGFISNPLHNGFIRLFCPFMWLFEPFASPGRRHQLSHINMGFQEACTNQKMIWGQINTLRFPHAGDQDAARWGPSHSRYYALATLAQLMRPVSDMCACGFEMLHNHSVNIK